MALSAAMVAGRLHTLIHGAARGADSIAHKWAERNSLTIDTYPVTREEWSTFGKSAGHRRNRRMLLEGRPDIVLAFWDGSSPGTRDMIEMALQEQVDIRVHFTKGGR
jgi:hypothetical protein